MIEDFHKREARIEAVEAWIFESVQESGNNSAKITDHTQGLRKACYGGWMSDSSKRGHEAIAS